MMFKVFSIFDSKAGAYMQPFFLVNHAMGIRAFGDACSDKNTVFGMHPEDYTLCQVASFDDSNGAFEPCRPLTVITGLEVRSLVQSMAAKMAVEAANGDLSKASSESIEGIRKAFRDVGEAP